MMVRSGQLQQPDDGHPSAIAEKRKVTTEIMVKAIKEVQPLFWGQSSHAITYCVARDLFNYDPNVTQYEEDVASLASQVKLDYPCPANTIATSIYNNPYQRYHVDKWPSLHVKPRCIKLAEAFRNEVKRLLEIENL